MDRGHAPVMQVMLQAGATRKILETQAVQALVGVKESAMPFGSFAARLKLRYCGGLCPKRRRHPAAPHPNPSSP